MAGLGSTPGIIVGAGVGLAAGVALEPAFELPKQAAWRANPNRLLDPNMIARLVAQGGIDLTAAHDDAARDGYGPDKLDALVYLAQTTPGVPQALFLWRLGLIDRELFRHVLRKAGIDTRYWGPLEQTFIVPLTAENVAVMVQRSIIPNQGQLPGYRAPGPGKVPAMPEVPIDAYKSALAYGVSQDQLDALTRIVGLPASPDLAARMTYRGIIEFEDFRRAIAQGNTRVEWADVLFEGFRAIPTANQFAELELRGYLDRPTRRRQASRHGMSEADSDLVYNLLGRSIPVKQVLTGFARGGSFGGAGEGIPEAYLQSLQRGNLRPEYYSLAYANRYSYPSAFFLRRLLMDGTLSAEEGEQLFLELGWPPELSRKIAAAFGGGNGAGGADPHVAKAEAQLWTTTHRSYVAEEAGDTDARERFGALGIAAPAQERILELWRLERSLVRAQLSPAQVKKALRAGLYTQEKAMQELLERGYAEDEAQTLLAE